MSNTNSLKVRFFKPSKQKLSGSVSEYGDSILITGEKNGVIDLGGNSELPSLISYMAQDITPDSLTGKRKLHYLILTHYHSDHITDDISAALLRLSNETESGVDLSECTVYLPHPDINWTAVVHDDMSTLRGRETICLDTLQGVNGLKALGKIHEVKHPNEGEEVNIGTDAKITFYNVDSNHYASYYAYQGSVQNYSDAGTDYNAFSMMTILEHCGHKFVSHGPPLQVVVCLGP